MTKRVKRIVIGTVVSWKNPLESRATVADVSFIEVYLFIKPNGKW